MEQGEEQLRAHLTDADLRATKGIIAKNTTRLTETRRRLANRTTDIENRKAPSSHCIKISFPKMQTSKTRQSPEIEDEILMLMRMGEKITWQHVMHDMARLRNEEQSIIDEINKAFDLMHEGKSIHSVVTFD